MPKFTVHVRQWVEETDDITVEADTVGEAIEKAVELAENGEVDWRDGNTIDGIAAFMVTDEKGDLIWEEYQN